MRSAVYLPPQAEGGKCLALHWLCGLARTEPNFVPKSLPRNTALPSVLWVPTPRAPMLEERMTAGASALVRGFYSNATKDPWKTNCRMFSCVTEERPQLTGANFPVDWQRRSILVTLCKASKNPGKYISVSAFAPVGHPGLCRWGKSMRCDLSRVLFGFPV